MCKSSAGVSATKELSTHDDKACNTVIRLFGRTIPISSGDEILHAAAGRPAKSLKSETDPQFKISASTIKSEDEEDHHPTTCFNKSKDSDDERPAAAPSVSLKGVTGASTNSLTNDETESSCAKSLSVEQQQRKRAEPEPETEESAVAVVAPSRCGGPGAGAVACPRCNSMETKFCYFNNYNVNQPRHFCRSCRRYWTAGGTIRNIPVGAGRRKSKHFHFQAAAAAAAAAATAAAPPCPAPALPSIMNATIPAAGVADFLNGLVYRGLKACESGSVSGSGPDSAARSIPAIQSKSFSQSQRSNFAFGISKLGPQ